MSSTRKPRAHLAALRRRPARAPPAASARPRSSPRFCPRTDALQALGKFYREKGSRARLSAEVREEVLAALGRAEAGLGAGGAAAGAGALASLS